MTGYAKVQSTLSHKKVNIEIKTLNSKQLDLIVKIPAAYRSRELEIRALLGHLERGKVECTISEENNATAAADFNRELLINRYNALTQVAGELHTDSPALFTTVAAMPDIWNSTDDSEVSDADWAILAKDIEHAIDLTDAFRSHEGEVLERDFHRHVDLIEQMLAKIPAYEAERIDTAKERIRRWMDEAAIKEVDTNRFEQELIYY